MVEDDKSAGTTDNPKSAIKLLAGWEDVEREYVRKSVGTALRDIFKKRGDLVKYESETWIISNKEVKQIYKLASKFLI